MQTFATRRLFDRSKPFVGVKWNGAEKFFVNLKQLSCTIRRVLGKGPDGTKKCHASTRALSNRQRSHRHHTTRSDSREQLYNTKLFLWSGEKE